MSDYSFILDDLYFSYSSVSNFDTCNYQFFLTYINLEERKQNFYSQYGTLIHNVLEKYFNRELESYELSNYYSENYDKIVTLYPPAYQRNSFENYKNDGKIFFDYFSFDRNLYDTILIEDSLKTEINGIKLIVKPDLILKEKSSNKYILFDYKSSNGFLPNGKRDNKKFSGYIKQMYLYKFYVKKILNIDIEKIVLWFPRYDKMEYIDIDSKEEEKSIKWFQDIINKIMMEEKFLPNNKNKFFCDNICSVSNSCEYKNVS